VEQWV